MPVYEYFCAHCDEKFEVKQGFEARTDIKCPECDGLANRKMSRFSFSFGRAIGRPSETMPGARRVEVG